MLHADPAQGKVPEGGGEDSSGEACDLLVTLTMGNPLFEPVSPGSIARIKSNEDVELCLSNPCYDQEQEQGQGQDQGSTAQGAGPGAMEAAGRTPAGEGAGGLRGGADGGEPGGAQGAAVGARCARDSGCVVEGAVADRMVHNPVATPFAEQQQQQQLGQEEGGEAESPWSTSAGEGWEDGSSEAGGNEGDTEEMEDGGEEEDGGSLFDNALLQLLWGDVDAAVEGQLPQQQMSVAVPLDDIPGGLGRARP